MGINFKHHLPKLVENKKIFGFFLILLIVLVWGLLNSKFSFDKYDPTYDMRGQYDVTAMLLSQSIFDYHQYPLWVPYVYGGTPYFQYPQNPIYTLAHALVVITHSFYIAFNLLGMVQLLILGFTLYLLLLELNLDYKYALIGSFTFMFNTPNLSAVTSGGELHFDSIVWLPGILLFIFMACKKQDWIKNSIFAGIFFALSFHAGDGSTFTHILFFVSLLAVYLIITGLRKFKKIVLIFVVIAAVLIGLSAVRLLPLMDFGKYSDLGGGRSLENAAGSHFEANGIMDFLIKFFGGFTGNYTFNGSVQLQIGLLAFLLALFSLLLIKNKHVLFFVVSIIIISTIATGSSLFNLLWNFFPGFNRQHHISRIMYLVPFCFSVLAAFGSKFLLNSISSRVSSKRAVNGIYILFFIVLFLGLPYKSDALNFKRINMEDEMGGNPLMVYLAEQSSSDLFRVHRWDLFNHIGGGYYHFWLPVHISTVHGQLNTFEPEYLFGFVNRLGFRAL